MNTLHRVANEEGLCGLVKGGVPALISTLLHPVASGVIKKLLPPGDHVVIMMLLLVPPIKSAITVIPENIKCKLQFQRGHEEYRGMLDCTAKIIKREGIRGLFSGYSAVLLRNVLSALNFALVTSRATSALIAASSEKDATEAVKSYLTLTGVGGLVTYALMYPLDVIKSYMQTANVGKKLSLRETAHFVYTQFGLRGFYRGISAAAVGTVVSATALCLVTYPPAKEESRSMQ